MGYKELGEAATNPKLIPLKKKKRTGQDSLLRPLVPAIPVPSSQEKVVKRGEGSFFACCCGIRKHVLLVKIKQGLILPVWFPFHSSCLVSFSFFL